MAGELILVQVESFPAVLEIWMRKPEDKKAVMQMSTEAVWVLQQLMVSMGASFLVLEPVTKGLITLEWDHKAGWKLVSHHRPAGTGSERNEAQRAPTF